MTLSVQAIDSASIWGIFKLSCIQTAVDDGVVLIGDAVSHGPCSFGNRASD